MATRRCLPGFSLIEVVIAIALVGGGVAVILALFPSIAQRTSDSADAHTALRLAGGVQAQLVAESAAGFDALVGSIPVIQTDPELGKQYVASRDGSDVRLATAAQNDVRGQYFLIVIRKYGSGPLAYDGQGVQLTVNVVVSWPYRVPSGTGLTNALPVADRRSVTYDLGVIR